MKRTLLFLFVAPLAVACSGGFEVGTTSEALNKVCGAAPNGSVQGVDVSVYQGNYDWQAAKNQGVAFGYARVSDGLGYLDAQFAPNWSKMKAAGVLRGAYMFFEPGEDATQQANLMVQKVGKLGDGDLPAMIDVEVTGGQSPAVIASKVQTWLDVVEKGTGKTPFIYTGAYFWQDSVQSLNFGKYPLWIANYGATCPLVPDGWQSWLIWQYSDGNGALDHDVFNGTLAQLQAYAHAPDAPPRGALDAADCTGARGWAQDTDTPTSPIDVHLYFDGAAGSGAHGVKALANESRPDLCQAIGSCEHGFSLSAPRSLLDAKAHQVFAYGIDSANNGQNPLLANAPKSFTCAAPAIGDKIRRWVRDPQTFGAWRFDAFTDVAPYGAALASLPKGVDLAAAPKLVRADGAPEIWVVDTNPKDGKPARRHVVDPASLAAWRFDAASVAKAAPADVAAMEQGPDWPRTPELAQGDTPEIDLLDVAWPSAPPPAQTGGGPNPGSGDGPPQAKGSGGCSASGGAPSASWLALIALTLVRRRRSSRGQEVTTVS